MLIKYIYTPKTYTAKVQIDATGPHAILVEHNHQPKGVVVSSKKGSVGWALCSPKDRYSKKIGLKIALSREQYYQDHDPDEVLNTVPMEIKDYVMNMYRRSERYYKE